MITLQLPEGRPDPAFLAAIAAGRRSGCPDSSPWEALTFEVDSGDLVDAGIDGEALRISPPLRFTIRPRALRIRLPQHASELSPTARQQRARGQVRGLLGSTRRAAAPRKP